MRVTVCIPTHNDAEHLTRAVDSVHAQTAFEKADTEIIVIDDGSTDRAAVHRALGRCGRDAGLRVYRVTNRGLPAARNTGLMLARGEAFLPLDADDWLEPTYIEKTLPLLEDADVVLTGLQEHGPTRKGCYMPGFDRPHHEVTEEVLWQFNRFFYCSLLRTQLLREVGGYNPRMAGGFGQAGGYEDYDLWIDLKRRGARFAAVYEPLFNYNTSNPNSMLAGAERNRIALVAEMRRHHA